VIVHSGNVLNKIIFILEGELVLYMKVDGDDPIIDTLSEDCVIG